MSVESILAKTHSYVHYTQILILHLSPSGSGRSAYNLHVTKATYFPIYCVAEERVEPDAECPVAEVEGLAM